jgi:hypothetical protein
LLDEREIRKIAEKIVSRSKRTAKEDTGVLKRSISYTYVRGELIFREIYYGQFGNNSELEKNAKKFVPNGTAWKIIYTKFNGSTYEVGKTRQGRARQSISIKDLLGGTSRNIKALIARNKAKRNGEAQK